MFVRTPAWHGVGEVPVLYPGSWAEARKLAKMDWNPIKVPSYGYNGIAADGSVVYDASQGVAGDYLSDPDFCRIVRSDNGYTLGVVSDQYQVIDHDQMGQILEALIDQDTHLKYECLFSIYGGRQVAAVIRLDEPITVPGDDSLTFPYLALTARHDGTGALRAVSTTVRVVCANTIAMSEAEGARTGTLFTFPHKGAWQDRIEEAQQTIRGLRREFAAYQELAIQMANFRISEAQEAQFVDLMIPTPPIGLVSERVQQNVEQARGQLRTIITGRTCEAIRGTAFGLVQAGVEYLDHYRRYRSLDSYAARQLLRPEPMKSRAIAIVREMVKA
jgi:phage/plasmid-like protein (TIGR03299 family)